MTLNRITWHHAASTYEVSAESKAHYHFIIDGDGEVHKGNHAVEDNAVGNHLEEGKYAAHTWKLNSGNIGISIAAMGDQDKKNKQNWNSPAGGRYPVRMCQVASLISLTAELAHQYEIAVTRRNVLSHAEVQPTLGVTQRGKWDFDYDPFYTKDTRNPVEVGDMLRDKVQQLFVKQTGEFPRNIQPNASILRQGDRGKDVEALQRRLGLAADGMFGPKTRDAVISFQAGRQLLRDGVVGAATWTALFGSKP